MTDRPDLKHRRQIVYGKLAEAQNKQGDIKRPYPNILQLAKNFTKSMIEVADEARKTGELLVEEDEFLDRLEICCGCELFDPSQIRCTHESCGCFLKAKGRLAAMYCPLYLWPGDIEKAMLDTEEEDAEETTNP